MEFQQDWPKDTKITAVSIFWRKTEEFRSTEHCGASLEGSTNFFLSQLFGLYVNGKLYIS